VLGLILFRTDLPVFYVYYRINALTVPRGSTIKLFKKEQSATFTACAHIALGNDGQERCSSARGRRVRRPEISAAFRRSDRVHDQSRRSSTGDELRRLYMAETTGPREGDRSWNTLQSDLREVVGVGLAQRNVRILRRVGRCRA
jgi:hypothetical protein